MSERPIFSSVTIFWLYAIGIASFAAGLLLAIFGEDLSRVPTAGANTYSKSAIGHRGFVEVLRSCRIPVVISQHASVHKAGPSAALIVAEPRAHEGATERIRAMLKAKVMLVVLPKWQGVPQDAKPQWLASARLIPSSEAQNILRLLAEDGRVVRPSAPPVWYAGQWSVTPDLMEPQLMQSERLTPVIHSDQGILVGQLRTERNQVWVLSDPDILSNHGLARGENALLAVGLIEVLRPLDGAVIFDETVHGFQREPSIWRVLFEFPFITATIQALITVLLLMWGATGRFGAPLPAESPLSVGKGQLIVNTANLLQFGGHSKRILRRYLDVTLRDVARQLNAPRALRGEGLIVWLDRIGERRNVAIKLSALKREIDTAVTLQPSDERRLVGVAKRLWGWKREMLGGRSSH